LRDDYLLSAYLSVADPTTTPDARFEITQELADKLATQLYSLDPCGSMYNPTNQLARKAQLHQIKEAISARGSKANKTILIYPNPFESNTTIKFSNDAKEIYNCTVYNLQGQSVKSILNIESNTFTIDASLMPKGMYWIELKSKSTAYRGKVDGELKFSKI
jgi:hypothetical protein